MYRVKSKDIVEVKDGILYVNGSIFNFISKCDEIIAIENNKLITYYKGCICFRNEWDLDDIEGEFK